MSRTILYGRNNDYDFTIEEDFDNLCARSGNYLGAGSGYCKDNGYLTEDTSTIPVYKLILFLFNWSASPRTNGVTLPLNMCEMAYNSRIYTDVSNGLHRDVDSGCRGTLVRLSTEYVPIQHMDRKYCLSVTYCIFRTYSRYKSCYYSNPKVRNFMLWQTVNKNSKDNLSKLTYRLRHECLYVSKWKPLKRFSLRSILWN
jgi:hypothetical protein